MRSYISNKADRNITLSSVSYVINDDTLLLKAKWTIGTTFKDVIVPYQDYIQARFDSYHNLYLVFDGYDDKLSFKATEHTRRSLQST